MIFPLLFITQKKKAIVVTARVHPGETPASWMMKGFMDFLTGDSLQARVSELIFLLIFLHYLNSLYSNTIRPDNLEALCTILGMRLNGFV